MKIFVTIGVGMLLAMVFAGCDIVGRNTDVEQSAEMKAASAADLLGEYDEAIAGYKETIARYPQAPLPYLKLALILHDEKKDYLGAIYNYRRYTELANPTRDASSLGMITNRIRVAEQLLAAHYVSIASRGNGNDNIELMKNVNWLNKQLEGLTREKNALVSSNETLRTKIVELNGQVTRLKLFIDKVRNTSDGGAAKNGSLAGVIQYQSVSNDDGTTTPVMTYEVRDGDTLSRIAEIAYGDSKKWPRIKRANPDKIKDERVFPGDILIIPDE